VYFEVRHPSPTVQTLTYMMGAAETVDAARMAMIETIKEGSIVVQVGMVGAADMKKSI
jgi:hypothetical protein